MAIIFLLIVSSIAGNLIHDTKTLCFIGTACVFIMLDYAQRSLEARTDEKIDRLHDRIDKLERR